MIEEDLIKLSTGSISATDIQFAIYLRENHKDIIERDLDDVEKINAIFKQWIKEFPILSKSNNISR